MADESTQSITINAAPDAVLAVIADFAAYPQWAKSVKSTEVTKPGPGGRAEQVAFKIDAGGIRDEYELAYTWQDLKVSWTLVKGQMQKAQRGSYTLVPTGAGATEVTYNLAVDLAIPMLGMLKRKAEKVVMDTALKELKKRVETG